MHIRLGRPQLLPGLAEALGHGATELPGRGVARDAVGVREQVAFQAGGLGVEIADRPRVVHLLEKRMRRHDVFALERGRDVENAMALRHRQKVIEDVAAGQAVENLKRAGWLLEAILAGLQSGARPHPAGQPELQRMLDHSRFREKLRDGAGSRAFGDIHEGWILETGKRHAHPPPCRASRSQDSQPQRGREPPPHAPGSGSPPSSSASR